MATDIIARGMASNAESKAQQAIDELSMVVEGRMNAEETEFTDLDGNVVVPNTETVYLDVDTYVYYRYNDTAYYIVSDPRGTVRYTAQTATSSEKAQARENIGAQEELSSGVNIKTINGGSILGSGNVDLFPVIPVPGSTTLTDAEFTLFKRGVVVNGEFLGYMNPVFNPVGNISGTQNWQGTVDVIQSNGHPVRLVYRISGATKIIRLTQPYDNYIDVKQIKSINGKSYPAYPDNPDTKKLLTYGTDNQMSWGDPDINTINASDIASDGILTPKQFALFTNGKDTKVLGTFLGVNNPTFTSNTLAYNFYYGIVIFSDNYYMGLGTYRIKNTTPNQYQITIQFRGLEYSHGAGGFILSNLKQINNKAIPSYPTLSTGDIPQHLVYRDDNTMDWDDDGSFDNVKVANNITDGTNSVTVAGITNALSSIAPQYDATAEYAVDDLVLQNNILYECNTPITTPEAFDPSKWTRTTIAQVFKRFQFTTVQ